MKSLLVGLVLLLAALAAAPALADDVKVVWPDYSKWSQTDAKPFLAMPYNSATEYGVPYLSGIEFNLGEVRWYFDDLDNPQMGGTQLVIFGKVIGRSVQKRGEPVFYQLLVDGEWVYVAPGVNVYLLDAKSLMRDGKMKGVVLEVATAEDGRVLRVVVTP